MSTDRATRESGPPTWDAIRYDRAFHFVTDHGVAVVELLAPREGEHVLDLGCGTGELTAQIAARGARTLGVDADGAMIDRARERFPGLAFERCDASEVRSRESFDAVFSNAALHWMLEPARVIAAVHGVLLPGGRFVAEMGAHGNVAAIVRAVRDARLREGAGDLVAPPWYFPTPAAYATLLERAGFEVRVIQLFDRPSPLEGGDQGMRDWLRMFGAPLFRGMDGSATEAVMARAVEDLRSTLFQGDRWVADYRRLRFVAVRAH